ncbi:hypothetical protein ZWY2020_046459 [Hordeum vulgare]|nr:hypothetical protein ZWY2020_046459 [Hordeum vulgare]
MSCNGCRVLRKGCGEGCTIRPCLSGSGAPDAQANATVFSPVLRPRRAAQPPRRCPRRRPPPAALPLAAHEACGRMANPVYGSVGLLWSAQWRPARPPSRPCSRAAPSSGSPPTPLAPCDIRHVAKLPDRPAAAGTLPGVSRAGCTRFKRASSSTAKTKSSFSDANKNDGLTKRRATRSRLQPRRRRRHGSRAGEGRRVVRGHGGRRGLAREPSRAQPRAAGGQGRGGTWRRNRAGADAGDPDGRTAAGGEVAAGMLRRQQLERPVGPHRPAA